MATEGNFRVTNNSTRQFLRRLVTETPHRLWSLKVSLLCLQDTATGPYTEPNESSPRPQTLFLFKIHSHTTLLCLPVRSSDYFWSLKKSLLNCHYIPVGVQQRTTPRQCISAHPWAVCSRLAEWDNEDVTWGGCSCYFGLAVIIVSYTNDDRRNIELSVSRFSSAECFKRVFHK